MLKENFEVFFNLDEFAELAVLPTGKTVKIVFDENYEPLLQEVFEGRSITAYGLTTDLDGLRHGQTIEIEGRSFSVDERRPTDDGKMTELLLREN
jgi:hypothetical protein